MLTYAKLIKVVFASWGNTITPMFFMTSIEKC